MNLMSEERNEVKQTPLVHTVYDVGGNNQEFKTFNNVSRTEVIRMEVVGFVDQRTLLNLANVYGHRVSLGRQKDVHEI